MDELTLFVLILVVSVSAHISIAWTAIAYHTKKAEKKWRAVIEDELLPKAAENVTAALEPQLQALPHAMSASVTDTVNGMSGKLEQTLNRDEGKAVIQELASFDYGSPLLNLVIHSVLMSERGPQVLQRLGKVARRVPVAGKYVDALMPGESEFQPDHTGTYTLSQ